MTESQKERVCSPGFTPSEFFSDEEFMTFGLERPASELNSDKYQIKDMTAIQYLLYSIGRSPLYCRNAVSGLYQYTMTLSTNSGYSYMLHPKSKNERILVNNLVKEVKSFAFYYGLSDEFRAVLAYLNDYTIDQSLFPYAYSILNKASQVIDEIITVDMTDFQKEKAIDK